MPKPLRVYKNGESVGDIYPSELQAWIDQGWSLDPNLIVEIEKKVSNLSDLSWKQLKDKATELGLEKPDNLTWTDFIPEIEKALNE